MGALKDAPSTSQLPSCIWYGVLAELQGFSLVGAA